ncbi:MAG: C69 family dipeptidase [Candidatus Aminicenantes bacterium]|nr:C69 family dipeptidase [Candidatus Aminicenantes bacterium]
MEVIKKRFGFILISLTLLLTVIFVSRFNILRACGQNDERLECFLIMAGKGTTSDGSVLLAHNNDLSGKEASLIEKYPQAKYKTGEYVHFPTGLKIPQAGETFEWMVLRIYKGFSEGDAVAVNEFQVAIAGGLALGDDRNEKAVEADPLIKKGLTGGVRYIALQRSKTARECVELIGSLYTKYGVAYPSGVGIADPEESWYIESGGGRSWAAIRIPDDSVWVQANGFRIGEIDFEDKTNFLSSPDLKRFAIRKGLWNPSEGKFHFARAFGHKKRTKSNMFYNSRRVWRGISLLAPELKLDPDLQEFPLFIKPEEKIDIKKLFSILRDHYEGTEYDVYAENRTDIKERAIAVPGSVHTNVLQLRGWMPNDIGAVLWAGVGPTPFAIYVPYYFGINDISKPFSTAGRECGNGSAFWSFKSLSDFVTPGFDKLAKLVICEWEKFEADEMDMQSKLEKKTLDLFKTDKKMAKIWLTYYSSHLSLKSLEKAKNMLKGLHNK